MGSNSQISVRELKNQTSRIIGRVQVGERITVIKRGRPVAVIEPLIESTVTASDSIYRSLQRQIEARNPSLRRKSAGTVRREFERISRKIARTMKYKDWREIDRASKGDRFGLSRP